ncbi:septum site-determining protein MinC [Abyssogena phaseoliformis symbiont OG214]|uniref:septum site-determining protein MinC n=1 Tax=Abyssogena phaseoliformis symbiont TaxID=596095 RepID=UPI001915921C|nr:septum site-determining protein MinC [Abyssogena phaseoliformis symbiont]BBB22853.1 septum site-determining protein MinC [Abyssogena phaseoliformis symbiont OG214]
MNKVEIITQSEVLYTLKIRTNDTDVLAQKINTLSCDNKQQFQYAPVIIQIEDKNLSANELAVLVEILTQNDMVAVGIRSDKQELIDFAKFSGMAVFGKSLTSNKPESIQEKTTKTALSLLQDKAYQAPKVVTNEVNSFEQIIAKDSDLVLLDEVKSGAEIMSFGNISAYKEVQGCLFAGIDGDEKATIFVQSFNAQLISIAGIYKRFDVVPTKLYARQVMIDLSDGKLRFQIV